MQSFKIADDPALEAKYKGAGYALAAVRDGKLIDLQYLRDIRDDLDVQSDAEARRVLENPAIGPTVRDMAKKGEVFFGMCSCYEFVPL